MIRVAVVGAGVMGTNHARILSRLPSCEVKAIVDPRQEVGAALAGSVGAVGFTDLNELIGRVDAAIVATPSETHADVGCLLLSNGIDVLVEKPIASDVEDAQRLIKAAQDADRILMVGHIERFNPSVIGMQRILDRAVHVEFTRIGPYSPRVTTDVVLDLMIHDIDLARLLAGSPIVSVQSSGSVVRSGHLDIVSTLLSFENGMTSTLTASRVGQNKIRTIEVTQEQSYLVADLIRQDVVVHRVEHSEFLTEKGSSYRQSGLIEIPYLETRGEPLQLELAAFLSSVTSREAPAVGGSEGLEALEIALRVRSQAGREVNIV